MMSLRAGSVFANAYEIVRQISAGGMGVVYEVIHLGTRRRRALKIMLAHIVSDPKMRERFTLEAVVTANIESEHLTEVFDAGIDAETDCPYLVMELLRGEDLGARLKRGERTSAEEVVLLMGQVAHALERTHAEGVVHRDLKPDNLFVAKRDDGSPRIKILDFGIAKLVKQDASGAQATTKTFGTPYYMAREQITGESALIGPASDLYAVAHIVFALLTGRPYFQDEARQSEGNVLALLMLVGQGTSESAVKRALRRGVELPCSFDAWFERATALAPADRFRSARSMVDALSEVLREGVRFTAGDRSPDPVSATSARIERSLSGASADASSSNPSLQQTGGPQSITTQVPPLARTAARAPLLVGAVALLGVTIGVAAWRLAPRDAPVEPSTAVAAAAAPQASAVGSAAPVVAPRSAEPGSKELASTGPGSAQQPAQTSALAASASSVAPSRTALESARPATAPARPAAARPGASPAQIWETR